MITLYSSISFIASAVMFVFSGFLYQGSSEKNIRAYTLYTASTACWALGIALYVFFTPLQYNFMLLSLRFAYATGIPTAAAFYYFSRLQKDRNADHRFAANALKILCAVQAGVYILTDQVVRKIISGPIFYQRIMEYNWFGFTVFNIVFTIIVTAAFINLWQAWHKTTDPERRDQSRLLFWAGIMAWWPPIVMCVILLALGNFNYYWIAPSVTSLWVMFTSYAIFRRNLFKVKVIVPAMLMVGLLLILFVNIFVQDLGNLFFIPR